MVDLPDAGNAQSFCGWEDHADENDLSTLKRAFLMPNLMVVQFSAGNPSR